eukprot:3875843-Prymnesium_polylepis.1
MMRVFRSWGGCLDTLIITYSLGLPGTCADSIARGDTLTSKRVMARHPGRSWAHESKYWVGKA